MHGREKQHFFFILTNHACPSIARARVLAAKFIQRVVHQVHQP